MASAELRIVEKEDNVEKTKALDAALTQIERAFGKGSVMRLGQRETVDTKGAQTAPTPEAIRLPYSA